MIIGVDRDHEGREVVTFSCTSCSVVASTYDGVEEMCPPSLVKGVTFTCGKSVADRDPYENPEEGCLGGLKACDDCTEEVGSFIEGSQNAAAIRREWEV